MNAEMCCSVLIFSMYCCDHLRHAGVTLESDCHPQQFMTDMSKLVTIQYRKQARQIKKLHSNAFERKHVE
jgi:hypothetical protein